MEIIAATNNGYLIQATALEVRDIYSAIAKPITKDNPIAIGDKIPAFDYAATIRSLRNLKDSYDYKELKSRSEKLFDVVKNYEKTLETLTFEK